MAVPSKMSHEWIKLSEVEDRDGFKSTFDKSAMSLGYRDFEREYMTYPRSWEGSLAAVGSAVAARHEELSRLYERTMTMEAGTKHLRAGDFITDDDFKEVQRYAWEGVKRQSEMRPLWTSFASEQTDEDFASLAVAGTW